jgi:archaemetzincin
MEVFKKYIFYILLFLLIFSCEKSKENVIKNQEIVTILIQPFEDIKPMQLAEISENIKKIYPNVKVLEPIKFQEIDTEQILLLNF